MPFKAGAEPPSTLEQAPVLARYFVLDQPPRPYNSHAPNFARAFNPNQFIGWNDDVFVDFWFFFSVDQS